MSYTFIAIAWILGVGIGYYIAKGSHGFVQKKTIKKINKEGNIIAFIMENEKITNNEVEELLKVSDATATRYLNKLEKEGRIVQIGEEGRGVYYILS